MSRLAELPRLVRASLEQSVRDCAVEQAGLGGSGDSGWGSVEELLRDEWLPQRSIEPDEALLSDLRKKYIGYLEDAASWEEDGEYD